MAAFVKSDGFTEALGLKKLNLATDQLKMAFTNAAASAAHKVLADLTEISYTNASSRNVTTTSFTSTGGVSKLICADLVVTASGGTIGPFRSAYLYSDTATNKDIIGAWDHGSSRTCEDGETITVDMDGTNGVVTV